MLIFVDCEAEGPCPSMGRLTEFGAVAYPGKQIFHGLLVAGCMVCDPVVIFQNFADWLATMGPGRPIFVSDNPAYDFQWINDCFHRYLGHNPFGHSARRIGDYAAGLAGDFRKTQEWKRLRVTPHDHNPVHDALGNLEAFERLLAGERP